VATEADAARDRVVAARASLGDELEVLEASARAAVDVPAKIRRNPVPFAAAAGGVAFLAVGGPRRVVRTARHRTFGAPEPLPPSLLPEQVDKALRELGDDGKKVRGALERDFAAYAKQAQRDRARLRTLLLLTVARPILNGAAKAGVRWLFGTDDESFQARLKEIRDRAKRTRDASDADDDMESAATGTSAATTPAAADGKASR
jgi:hypothetical protein